MVKTKLLTKTCSSCGQQKPLTAFLQISGTQGTAYGNICASCRKTEHEKPKQIREIEEGTSSDSGLKIDSKHKVHSDIKKKEEFIETEELYFQEREKNEEKQDQRIESIQHTAKEERKHRDTILSKGSFLDSTNKAKRASASQQIFGGEAQKAKAAEIGIDATSDLAMGKSKYKHSEALKRYFAWAGETPLGRATKQNPTSVKDKNKNADAKGEKTSPSTEYVKTTWRKS